MHPSDDSSTMFMTFYSYITPDTCSYRQVAVSRDTHRKQKTPPRRAISSTSTSTKENELCQRGVGAKYYTLKPTGSSLGVSHGKLVVCQGVKSGACAKKWMFFSSFYGETRTRTHAHTHTDKIRKHFFPRIKHISSSRQTTIADRQHRTQTDRQQTKTTDEQKPFAVFAQTQTH